jgi:hypothetical protein
MIYGEILQVEPLSAIVDSTWREHNVNLDNGWLEINPPISSRGSEKTRMLKFSWKRRLAVKYESTPRQRRFLLF